ncbi:hypothetical protein T492DRAFT_1010179 [Pavlovales sp. CCMP2436]|nr:hypothetical protein T492DRAFT_1010179 [Pavlovales sp. CCMP2436]
MIARAHPCLGAAFPLFLISEMPHLIKKLRNALWASWLSGNKRNLGRPNDPALNSTMLYAHAHLGMLEEAWLAIEGAAGELGGQLASLRQFRFSQEDFKLNCLNKMRVPAAMRVQSASACRLIDLYMASPDFEQHHKGSFLFLREWCENINPLADLCNGRDDEPNKGTVHIGNIKSADSLIIKELVQCAAWFAG